MCGAKQCERMLAAWAKVSFPAQQPVHAASHNRRLMNRSEFPVLARFR
jgi:hypothetical protein